MSMLEEINWPNDKNEEESMEKKLRGLLIGRMNMVTYWTIVDLDWENSPEIENFNQEVEVLLKSGKEVSQDQYNELENKQIEIIKQLKKNKT